MKNVEKNKCSLGKMIAFMAVMVTSILLFAGVFTMEAQAATGKVTATSANVRKEADKDSDAVGGLLKNDTFTVKGQVTGSDGKVWYLIEFGDGQGYVRSDLVSVEGEVGAVENNSSTNTAQPTVQTSGVTKLNPVSGTVTGKVVNIRAGAGSDKAKVTSVNKDTVLTIVGQATGSDNKVWYQVNFISNNEEVTGFIRSDYVDPAGDLTPYTEPVQPEEPETPAEPEEPETPAEPEEPEVPVETKDWDTVKVDEKWMLVENSSGKYYSVNDLIQISKQNAEKLEAAQGTISGQKATIVILVIVLVVLGLVIAFVVFRFKDLIMEEILGMKEEPAPVKRAETQRKPMPQGQRPAGQGQRPAGQGQRPAGQGQRPAGQGQRPAGQGQRPASQGQRPAGQGQRPVGQGQRPAGQGQRPVGQGQRPAGAPVKKPAGVSVEGLNPTFDMTDTKEEQIRKETNRSLEKQEMESKVALNDNSKKAKNFMADEDEFEFEFLNWDGDDEEE